MGKDKISNIDNSPVHIKSNERHIADILRAVSENELQGSSDHMREFCYESDEPPTTGVPAFDQSTKDYYKQLQSEGYIVLVYVRGADAKVVGIICFIDQGKEIYLRRVGVDISCQNQNVGTILFPTVTYYATKIRPKKIATKARDAKIGWFKSQGFDKWSELFYDTRWGEYREMESTIKYQHDKKGKRSRHKRTPM